MEFNLALLKRLAEAPGIAGYEDAARALVLEELCPLVDDLCVGRLGNVLGVKRGYDGPRVMLSAHMDEIGFLVRYVAKGGRIRV